MTTILTAEKQVWEVFPTGEYLAQITDFEEESGNFGPQFRIKFELVKPKAHAGKSISGWCSQKLISGNKKSKLWGWVEAAWNRPVEVGEEVDLDDLVGRQVVLVVITESKEDGTEYNKISAIKPYKQQEPWPKGGSTQTESPDSFEVDEDDDDGTDPFVNE